MIYGTCERCGEPVTTSPAFPVVGWEVVREQGGANHIRNRVRLPDRVRHVACLPAASVHEDQGVLL